LSYLLRILNFKIISPNLCLLFLYISSSLSLSHKVEPDYNTIVGPCGRACDVNRLIGKNNHTNENDTFNTLSKAKLYISCLTRVSVLIYLLNDIIFSLSYRNLFVPHWVIQLTVWHMWMHNFDILKILIVTNLTKKIQYI